MAIIEAIASCYLEAPATSVEFQSIPGTYETLQIRASIRTQDDGDSGRSGNLKCRLNNSGATIYSNQLMLGGDFNYAGSVDERSWSNASDDYMNVAYGPTQYSFFPVYGSWIIDIIDYANTNKNAVLLSFSGYGLGQGEDTEANTANNGGPSVNLTSHMMANTDAVTRIKLFGHSQFNIGSSFNLYGLKSS